MPRYVSKSVVESFQAPRLVAVVAVAAGFVVNLVAVVTAHTVGKVVSIRQLHRSDCVFDIQDGSNVV